MQNGQKPTWKQKKLLTKNKLDSQSWLYIKEVGKKLIFRNRETGEVIELTKNM